MATPTTDRRAIGSRPVGASLDFDAQGFVSAADGTRLFWGTMGEGPAIVLNDGIGCDGFAWRYLGPELAKKHRVIRWHYRGHGRSGPPVDPARLDMVALARDLAVVLDHLEVESALLAGHSMGTQVCLETYRHFPARVVGMVLLCGSYGRVTHSFHGSDLLSQVLPRVIETARSRRGLARALWSRVPSRLAYRIAKLSGEVDAATIREEDFVTYWDHISVMDPDVFLSMLRLAGDHSAEDLLPAIEVPTLVIAADRDTFTPPALAKAMADAIPDAEFMRIRGGSHAAPVEQPGTIGLRIEKFLLDRIPQGW